MSWRRRIRRIAALTPILFAFAVAWPLDPGSTAGEYDLWVSGAPDRSSARLLEGASVAGDIFVFVLDDTDVTGARFFIDDPAMTGSPHTFEGTPPIDLAGTASDGTASPFDSSTLGAGEHTISARLRVAGARSEVIHATFTVDTAVPAPELILDPAAWAPAAVEGTAASTDATIDTVDGSAVEVTLAADQAWLSADVTSGTTPLTVTVTADASELAPGDHTATLTATAPEATPAILDVTLAVEEDPAPGLMFTPTSWEPTAVEGGTVSVDVVLDTTDASVTDVSVVSDQTWLTASSATATTPDTLTLTADASSLGPGPHVATLTATAVGYTEATLPVTLDVAAPPSLTLTDTSVVASVAEGRTAAFDIGVETTDDGPADVTVATSASWLQATPELGPTPLTVAVTADAAGLVAGVHLATVTATAEGYEPATVEVELEVYTAHTAVSIVGTDFHVNGQITNEGRPAEGLLLNSRMVQAAFDDANSATVDDWAYPDTGVWDPDRNVAEFLAQLPTYALHGLDAVTINFQGGNPMPTSSGNDQPWHVSAFDARGSLDSAWLDRMDQVIRGADEHGIVVIVGYFYFGQDHRLDDEAAVLAAVDNATDWLLERAYTNVLVEIANESTEANYDHEILRPGRIVELITRVQDRSGGALAVSTSFPACCQPGDDIVDVADFVLLHGGDGTTLTAGEQVADIEGRAVYQADPTPIVFNEDPVPENFAEAVAAGASWGFMDADRLNDYEHGFQAPPIDWSINTPSKQDFFDEVTYFAHASDLSLTTDVGAATPHVGDDVTLTVTLANAGPDDSGAIEVLIEVPTDLDVISAPPDVDLATGIWTAPSVAAGTDAVVELAVRATEVGETTIAVEVTASAHSDPDSTPDDGVGDDASTVSIDAALAPALDFAPDLIEHALEEGTTAVLSASLDTTDGSSAVFDVSDDADWLTVDATTGTTPITLDLTVDTTGLSPGTYSATVTASAPGLDTTTLAVTITVDPLVPPALTISPGEVTLTADEGAAAIADVTVDTDAGSVADVTVTTDSTWLAVHPTGGATPLVVTLTADAATLGAGTHSATVTATAPGHDDAELAVTFEVVTSGPALRVSTSSDRADSTLLEGAELDGLVYIFVSPADGVTGARFYIDDPDRTGRARTVDRSAPFDFNGTAQNGDAIAFDTGSLTAGSHTVTAQLRISGSPELILSSAFDVE